MDMHQCDELVRRLAAATRGASLYSTTHPLVQRGVDALTAICDRSLQNTPSIVIGFLGDHVVVDDVRLQKSGATLLGFARHMRAREVEKITFAKGVTSDEIRSFVTELADNSKTIQLSARLAARGIKHIAIGKISVADGEPEATGIAAARHVYHSAVGTAQALWDTAKAGDQPDPAAAGKLVDSLARLVNHDRTSLMALTALKKYDNYTFTHMVNVSVLAMALARSLNLDGALLREFGFAALMHDIGKVNIPLEILNKPDQLSGEEFGIMKQHVVDGAHILRRTPEMPALAPIVAFEHHLKQDLSGYPENIGSRKLNVCTQIVSIVDVYDALRSNRIYRDGLPTQRIRAIMAQQTSTAFNQKLLRRFINLVGLFPVGTLVRLSSEEIALVTVEHPNDPFRPQVKVLIDARGNRLEDPVLINTWEHDIRGDSSMAVVEAIDPETVDIDPLSLL